LEDRSSSVIGAAEIASIKFVGKGKRRPFRIAFAGVAKIGGCRNSQHPILAIPRESNSKARGIAAVGRERNGSYSTRYRASRNLAFAACRRTVLGLDILFGAALGAEASDVPFAFLSPHVSIRTLPGMPQRIGLAENTAGARRYWMASAGRTTWRY
jgi:hypothetical protein